VQQRRSRDTEEEDTQAVILALQHSFAAIVLAVAFWLVSSLPLWADPTDPTGWLLSITVGPILPGEGMA
jgi:hypothetical protein